ncbi:MAG: toxin-antitoxin system HicB family antitoxin [Erythrobacter sp.]|nr:toxin-antitoxin system HicB family antitoxin [Erythrobacter sp.]MBA4081414.1 toxin-antitoxin system HicB family antitoxin [Erythrobacter sp.]
MNKPAIYQLRLPKSVKAAVAQWAERDGISMNQFMATAVAEKISVLATIDLFEDRAARADYETFDRVMNRKGGEEPRAGDEIDG